MPGNRRDGKKLRVTCAAVLVAAACACDHSPRYEIKINLAPAIAELGSNDAATSDGAIETIVALGEPALPALRQALDREELPTRLGIIEVLRQLDSPAAVSLLLVAANDPDATARAEALLGLGEIGDERGRSVVEAALYDEDRTIALAAADACATLCRTPKSVQRLTEMAIHLPPFAAMAVPRQSLRYMLLQNDERASAAKETINAVALPLLEPATPAEVRTRAALVLADAGDDAGLSWLNALLMQPVAKMGPPVQKQMRLQAMAAIGAVGDASSLAALRQARDNVGSGLRNPACRALHQLAERGIEGAAVETAACGQEG